MRLGGGGGGGGHLPFIDSMTGLAVAVTCVTESADRATAEMTMSLQADLVLSDAAATNEP